MSAPVLQVCGRCGKPLPPSRGGPPRRWCSATCRVAATRTRAAARAATPLAQPAPPDRLHLVTAVAIEEPPAVPEHTPAELPPLPLTGDDETDEALALMRSTTGAIHDAQDRVAELSSERKRLVLHLRRRRVLFRHIAQAANSTEQTILKIHREAKRDEAHEAGDHSRCSAANCEVVAAREAEEERLTEERLATEKEADGDPGQV